MVVAAPYWDMDLIQDANYVPQRYKMGQCNLPLHDSLVSFLAMLWSQTQQMRQTPKTRSSSSTEHRAQRSAARLMVFDISVHVVKDVLDMVSVSRVDDLATPTGWLLLHDLGC